MCGIAGFIDFTLASEEANRIIEAMLQSIAHRGPDARGTYFDNGVMLGHNRLSIIDLSSEGNQPMEYFDAVIIFNGELYNYIEIKDSLTKKGYVFTTKSDTEVVLAAWRAYGKDCVKEFIGMWAFALWDKKEKILFCSRDRFGIKPFYYLNGNQKFYFGSEYKALKKSPEFSYDINLDQVRRGLQLGWVCYNDESYFKNLKSLPAACNLIYKNGEIAIEKYWSLDLNKKSLLSFDEKKEMFSDLFKESIFFHMRSDVEIAICLSGGIDSSALSGMMATLYPQKDFRSFSIFYEGADAVDERPFINAVAEKFSNIKLNLYQPNQEEIIELFSKILYASDVPATGSSFISHYYLIEKINKEKIKVVLDGQGSDEYLAGYMHSMYRYFADEISGLRIGGFIKDFKSHVKNQEMNSSDAMNVFGKSILSAYANEQQLYSFEFKHYYPSVLKYRSEEVPFNLDSLPANKLNSFLYHLLTTSSLPTILHYVDRMTMAHSVESRVPFLDHRMVELAFTFSNEDKISGSVTKYILREALKKLLPEKVYNRKDKKGFVTPGEVNWLRKPLRNLLDIDFSNFEYWNKELVQKLISDYLAGNNKNAKLVWRIATLNYWLKNI